MGLVAFASLGSGACVSKGKYETAVAALKKCQSEKETCSRDLQATRTRLEETNAQNATLIKDRDAARAGKAESDRLVGEMEKNLSTTRAELADLRRQRAEAEKRLAAFKALTAKFQAMIDSGKIKVVFRGGRMIVELPAGILFASGKADLSKDGTIALTEVAQILKEFPDRNFLVAGHTDAAPLKSSRFKDNWELSSARALVVTRFLVGAGLDPRHLAAAGYGEHDPVGDNATEDGRQQNRRIEIILLPNLDELPKLSDVP